MKLRKRYSTQISGRQYNGKTRFEIYNMQTCHVTLLFKIYESNCSVRTYVLDSRKNLKQIEILFNFQVGNKTLSLINYQHFPKVFILFIFRLSVIVVVRQFMYAIIHSFFHSLICCPSLDQLFFDFCFDLLNIYASL